jgi:hypothetical protein
MPAKLVAILLLREEDDRPFLPSTLVPKFGGIPYGIATTVHFNQFSMFGMMGLRHAMVFEADLANLEFVAIKTSIPGKPSLRLQSPVARCQRDCSFCSFKT